MTDLFLPPVRLAKVSPRLIDQTGRFVSPLSGATRTVGRPGDRWGFRLDYSNLLGFDRARLESLIAHQRGATNRVLWSPTIEYPQRGSFPSGELFANNDFSSGVSPWVQSGGGTSLAVLDGRLRITYVGSGIVNPHQSVANMTANQPFVARYFYVDGLGGLLGAGALQCYIEGSGVSKPITATEGLSTVAMVVDSTSGAEYVAWGAGGGGIIAPGLGLAGDYIEAVWTSLSQCFLVDSGGNLLQFSDTLASPWTTSACSVTPNANTSADGSVTAAGITDTTANSAHYVGQAGVAIPGAVGTDMMICGEFHAQAQPFVWLQIFENTGSSYSIAWFNLSTGAPGSTSVGANWANARSFIVPMGNNWYFCCLVARKTNNATASTVQFGPSAANSAQVYTGAGTVALSSRRVTYWPSSVPADQVQSGNVAVAAAVQTGSALNVKGLYPLGTQGLLLAGDWIEINKELKRLTAQLDSDAAGRGWLQFSPPMRNPPSDNDPVIVNKPMGRFIFSSQETGWSTVPGYFSTSSIDLQESGS